MEPVKACPLCEREHAPWCQPKSLAEGLKLLHYGGGLPREALDDLLKHDREAARGRRRGEHRGERGRHGQGVADRGGAASVGEA
jgi:hypothetical protein